ncbi:MAG TPA: peptidylprolyl isomerase [Actinomycetota bacterium]|jgi:cyclophilin family peptidyl-prolyl cis-trans isomerase|nr:peptidylprolyl isomerase [Actinomycetota bacterium]
MNNVPNPKRQRQKELRRLKLEQERKAALAKKRRTAGILGVLAAVVVIGALFFVDRGGDDPEPAASATPADPSDPKPVAVMTTSEGPLEIELATDTSPNVAAAFQAMAKEGFYDGLTFHRIVKDFAIQGGDPAGNGTGGPDTKTVDAIPEGFRYVRGTVAMAKGGDEEAGTAGSQFFIVPSDAAADRLTPDYAILGKVISGLETVDKLNAVPTSGPAGGEQSTPVNPVTIEKVEIKEP